MSEAARVTHSNHGLFILQLGGFWRSPGNEQFIHIQDLVGDRFTVTNQTAFNGLVGAGYFVDTKIDTDFKTSLGVHGFYLPRTPVSGTVIQENLFTNLFYQYNITNYPVYVAAKGAMPLLSLGYEITLNAGIGPNFMRLSHFEETSVTQTTAFSSEPQSLFSFKTNTHFSVTAGVGMLINPIFGNAPLECGYQFFYLGEGRFNIANDQLMNTLKTGKIYANAAVCSIHI